MRTQKNPFTLNRYPVKCEGDFGLNQNGERGILSLRSRLRSIANEAYAPTNL